MEGKASYSCFIDIMRKRYATKVFDGRKIEKEKIIKILEAVRLSPSSYNLQPWKVFVVSEDKIKEELFPFSFNQKQVTTSSHVLVFCAVVDRREILEKYRKIYEGKYPKGMLEKRINFLKDFLDEKDDTELLNYAQMQVYLAIANVLNAAKSLGIDSCPMAGFDPENYSRILSIPRRYVPTLIVALGYSAEKEKEKVRNSIDDIAEFI